MIHSQGRSSLPLPACLAASAVALASCASTEPSTQIVSVDSGEVAANQPTTGTVSISADGRYVVFSSGATNLDPIDDTGGVFLRDTLTGETEKVSLSSVNQAGPGGGADMSADGRFIVFTSAGQLSPFDLNDFLDVYVRDLEQGTTELVSVFPGKVPGDGDSKNASISADGRFVVFESEADNLSPYDNNGLQDIYIRDLDSEAIEIVSVRGNLLPANGSSFHPTVSDDGRFVAFSSQADNLVPFSSLDAAQCYVRDREEGETEMISVRTSSDAGNVTSGHSVISGNGRYVLFATSANNLSPLNINGVMQIFMRDRVAQTTQVVSLSDGGVPANGRCWPQMAISPDGRFIAFPSEADNLLGGSFNEFPQIYVRDLELGVIELVSVSLGGVAANDNSFWPALSDDGQFVAFVSRANDLVPDSEHEFWDVFLRDRGAAEE